MIESSESNHEPFSVTDRTDEPNDVTDDAEPVLFLPDSLRSELKDPLGPVETDAERLLADVSGPLYAVGDVVTYHLSIAGRRPDVAIVDGITEREAVDEDVLETVTAGPTVSVANPPAAITTALVRAVRRAIADEDPITIVVDGEEDLAVLPVIVLAPDGASVVYGQPGEGMVHVRVDEPVREDVRSLLERFDGDVSTLFPDGDR